MRTTIWRSHLDIPDHNGIVRERLLYHELAKHIGEVPPSGRNHGNKQYPIAKTRKHNNAQNHIFIYLNN